MGEQRGCVECVRAANPASTRPHSGALLWNAAGAAARDRGAPRPQLAAKRGTGTGCPCRTRAYFSAKDSGRYAEAYAMLTPALQANSESADLVPSRKRVQQPRRHSARASAHQGHMVQQSAAGSGDRPLCRRGFQRRFRGSALPVRLCRVAACKRTVRGGLSGRNRAPRPGPMRRTHPRRRSRKCARNRAAATKSNARARGPSFSARSAELCQISQVVLYSGQLSCT